MDQGKGAEHMKKRNFIQHIKKLYFMETTTDFKNSCSVLQNIQVKTVEWEDGNTYPV